MRGIFSLEKKLFKIAEVLKINLDFELEIREKNKSVLGYCVPSKNKIILYKSNGKVDYHLSTIINTFIHELAHLIHFNNGAKKFKRLDHSPEFFKIESKLLIEYRRYKRRRFKDG